MAKMAKKQKTEMIAVFKGNEIRRTVHKNEWWFSVADVVEVLTATTNVRDYIKKLKKRDPVIKSNWGTICPPVEMLAKDGKKRKVSCSNVEGLFRIIQSIPSPRAEPFKRWLARVGYERIKEIEDPELATKRTKALYKAKGYPNNWIEKRMRGIAVREELTDEWKDRNVKEGIEYAILTAEISKAAFGVTPKDHKKIKSLKRQTLRDHMTDLELIFSMLGEASTTEITRVKDSKGFIENKESAKDGGEVAGKARKDLEKKTRKKIVTKKNYLGLEETKKLE